MTALRTGSIVRIWHGTRGHDYVIACVNRAERKIGLIKNNCINNDGSIHASTNDVHKWVDYQNLGGERIVPKINRVIGYRAINDEYLVDFLRIVAPQNVIALREDYNVRAGIDLAQDNRAATMF